MADVVALTQGLGQAVWIDYVRRGMLKSGEIGDYIEQGISGVTSNPTIFERAIVGSTDYDPALRELASGERSAKETYEALALDGLPVPGEPYTFGVVAAAQALGDLEALRSLGRQVSTVRLGPGGDAAGQLRSRISDLM